MAYVDGTCNHGFTVDFTVPENILAWWRLRDTLADFGIVYNRRIIIYIGAFLLVVLSLLVFVLAEVLLGNRTNIYVIMSVIIYLIIVFTVLFMAVVSIGGDNNEWRQAHDVEILKKKSMLEYIISSSNRMVADKTINDILLCLSVLSCVHHLIVTDNHLNVTRILGFDAGSQLGRALVVVGLAGLGTALRSFF